MSNQHWLRLANATGAASFVLLVAGSVLGNGGTPGLGASRAEEAGWVARHAHLHARDVVSGALELGALLFLLAFVAVLWRFLAAREEAPAPFSAISLAGGSAMVVLKLASLPAAFAAMYRAPDGWNPQVITALLDMNDVAFVLLWPLLSVMLGAAAVVLLRSGALHRFFGVSAAVLSVLLLAAVPLANGPGPLAFVLAYAWIGATSVALARREAVDYRPALTPATAHEARRAPAARLS
jgi:hypothetical protein